jgi:hypothetical protein
MIAPKNHKKEVNMPAPELLERPSTHSKNTVQLPSRRPTENISLILGILFAVFVGALFLKLMEYEASHAFQWLHHSVQVDPTWY